MHYSGRNSYGNCNNGDVKTLLLDIDDTILNCD